MKSRLLGIFLILALTIQSVLPMAAAAAASSPVTVNAIGTVATGGSVRISGWSTFGQLIVYLYRPDGTVLYYKQLSVTSEDNSYSVAVTLPEDSVTGTYTAVVGYGDKTTKMPFEVKKGAIVSSPVTVNPIGTVAQGDSFRITGTSTFGQLIVYIYRPDGTVLYYKQLTVNAEDNSYSDVVTIPKDSATGIYTAVVGYGDKTAKMSFEVKKAARTGGGGGSGGGTSTPSNVMKIEIFDIKGSLKDGKAAFKAEGKDRILLPQTAAELLKEDGKLSLTFDKVTLDIPSAVLKAASAIAPSDRPASSLVLTVKSLDKTKIEQLANDAAKRESAKVKPAGDFSDIQIGAVLVNGNESYLDRYPKPLVAQFKYAEGADRHVANVFATSTGGNITYVPTKGSAEGLQASLEKPGTYGVLAIDKTYNDVTSDFWAAPVIRWLSAKQIVSGVEEAKFDPQAPVTRAQFATLLVRGMGIQPGGTKTFSDVRSNDWFAPYVAAAAEAGIVNGAGDNVFAPNAPITREAMAVMVIRAYERQSEKQAAKGAKIPFKDQGEVSEWAADAIGSASGLGLIQGSDNLFRPKGLATRAESTQILAKLLGYNEVVK